MLCRHDLRLEERPKPLAHSNFDTTVTTTPREAKDSVLRTQSPSLPPSTARSNQFENINPAYYDIPSIHVASSSIRACPAPIHGSAVMHEGPNTAPQEHVREPMPDAQAEGSAYLDAIVPHTTGGGRQDRMHDTKRRAVSSGARIATTTAKNEGKQWALKVRTLCCLCHSAILIRCSFGAQGPNIALVSGFFNMKVGAYNRCCDCAM